VDTAVFLPAFLLMLETERTIFAVTGRAQVHVEPQLLEIGTDRVRPTLAQDQVIRGGSYFIAAPFQENPLGASSVSFSRGI
jgi:hypothetical protein